MPSERPYALPVGHPAMVRKPASAGRSSIPSVRPLFKAQIFKIWKLQGELEKEPIGTSGATESERGQGRVEIDETSPVVGSPCDSGVLLESEGVNLVQMLEVAEVRRQHVRREIVRHGDVDPSRVSEEATFAHVGQGLVYTGEAPSVLPRLLASGTNATVAS